MVGFPGGIPAHDSSERVDVVRARGRGAAPVVTALEHSVVTS
jgi:hypothetical protein